MRGRLSREKWAIFNTGGDFYLAERIRITQGYEQREIKAHCLACAKVEILSQYGGEVDLRGWHKSGTCGSYLKSLAIAIKQEGENAKDN